MVVGLDQASVGDCNSNLAQEEEERKRARGSIESTDSDRNVDNAER